MAKSRALAHRNPPAVAVYLFSPNDFDDDARAAAVARRSRLAHSAHEMLDAVRRRSYLAGIPFALRYRLQFRAGPAPAAVQAVASPESLLLPQPQPLEPQDGGATPVVPGAQGTLTALLQYRDFLDARGARLLVLVLSNQPESLAAYRFCREQGIEAHLFDVPPSLRIPDEGHFSAAGNEAVAADRGRAVARRTVAAGGLGSPLQARSRATESAWSSSAIFRGGSDATNPVSFRLNIRVRKSAATNPPGGFRPG